MKTSTILDRIIATLFSPFQRSRRTQKFFTVRKVLGSAVVAAAFLGGGAEVASAEIWTWTAGASLKDPGKAAWVAKSDGTILEAVNSRNMSSGGDTFIVNGVDDVNSYSGNISGGAMDVLTKQGTGILRLSGNNVYGDPAAGNLATGTELRKGTIGVMNNIALGKGGLLVDAGDGETVSLQFTIETDPGKITNRMVVRSGTLKIDRGYNDKYAKQGVDFDTSVTPTMAIAGGAFDVTGGNVQFVNGKDPGIIKIVNNGTMTVDGVTSTSVLFGGGVGAYKTDNATDPHAVVDLSDRNSKDVVVFENNTAALGGGGMGAYAAGGNATVTTKAGSVFQTNKVTGEFNAVALETALDYLKTTGANTTVIASAKTTLDAMTTLWDEMKPLAVGGGVGALSVKGKAEVNKAEVNISVGTTFSGNTAGVSAAVKGFGGAAGAYAFGENGQAVVNTAGAVWDDATGLPVPQSGTTSSGNPIYMGHVYDGTATSMGGGFAAIGTGGSSASYTSTGHEIFQNNSAAVAGGAVAVYSDDNNATAVFKGQNTFGNGVLDMNGNIIIDPYVDTGLGNYASNAAKNAQGGAIFVGAGETKTASAEFQGINRFNGNWADSNGGAIRIQGGNAVLIADKEMTFSDNASTYGSGGAISLEAIAEGGVASAEFNDTLNLGDAGAGNKAGRAVDNTTGANGAGVSIISVAGSAELVAVDVNAFNNVAQGSGGAIYIAGKTGATADYGDIVSNNNRAEQGSGGFINLQAEDGDAKFTANSINAKENYASVSGGVIYSEDAVTLGTGSRFTDNSAGTDGGAIWAGSSVYVSGNTKFIGNKAGRKGGAIYTAGNGVDNVVVLDATDGNILFEQNKQGAQQRDNAIFMEQNTQLVVRGEDNVYLCDGIDTSSSGNSFAKYGTGMVQFAFKDDNWLNRIGDGGAMNLYAGTIRVVEGAGLHSIGNDAQLILDRGGTLAGGGSVSVDNTDADFKGPDFLLHGTISPDSDTLDETHTEIDGDKRIGVLTLGGDALFSGASLDIDIEKNNVSDTILVVGEATSEIDTFDYIDPDSGETKTANITNVVNADRWLQGKYLVVDANAMDAEFKDTFGVEIADKDSFANRDRAWLTVETGTTGGLEDMYLNMKHVKNANLSWTGAESNDWNDLATNWKDRANDAPEKFETFDRVFFGSAAEELDVQVARTATVSDMCVHGGEYTFDGAAIKGVKDKGEFLDGNAVNQEGDGILYVMNQGTRATFNNSLDFEGDIIVMTGAEASFLGDEMVKTHGRFHVSDASKVVLQAAENKVVADSIDWGGRRDNVELADGQYRSVFENPSSEALAEQVVRLTDALEEEEFDALTKEMDERFDIKRALYERDARTRIDQDNGDALMDVYYRSTTITDWINDTPWCYTENKESMAELIDEYVKTAQGQDLKGFFYGRHEGNDLVGGIENEQYLCDIMTGTLGGELAADAQTLALWRPYDKTHRRLYEHTSRAANVCGPSLTWSRTHCWELWGEASHTSQDVDSDGNALEYDVKRWGVTVGADRKFSSRFLGGMMFAYGNPKLRHQIGRVEADDYTFGLYGQARLDRKYYVNLFLGYGFQNYDYSRNSGGRAKYDGDAMYAGAEFFRSIHYYSRVTLFPLLAFDFQKSWADGFTERGGMIPLQIGKASMEQTMIRIGLNSRIRWNDRLNLHTRLQYGVLAGGDREGTAVTSLVGNPGISRPLYGVDLGQNRLNVGVGGEWKWTKRMRLFGDYDFDLGDRGTAHTGQFGFVTNW